MAGTQHMAADLCGRCDAALQAELRQDELEEARVAVLQEMAEADEDIMATQDAPSDDRVQFTGQELVTPAEIHRRGGPAAPPPPPPRAAASPAEKRNDTC